MKNFTNKVAAITGASSGIGRGLALELGRRGCNLALCDINEMGLEETVSGARSSGVHVTSQKVDVADREAVYAWADQTLKDHGKVNLIFNNAGVGLGSTIEGMTYEEFEWLMNINFWGVVYGTKAFLPHLKAAGEGHIINISSVFGLVGVPTQGAYNAAKFAVRGFTECLRVELDMMECGVSATSIHPGGIQTDIARSSRVNPNVRALGLSDEGTVEKAEKQFITSADKAARIILGAVEKNKRRAMIGPDAYIFDWTARALPSAYQRIVRGFMKRVMD